MYSWLTQVTEHNQFATIVPAALSKGKAHQSQTMASPDAHMLGSAARAVVTLSLTAEQHAMPSTLGQLKMRRW